MKVEGSAERSLEGKLEQRKVELVLPYPPTVNHYWYARPVFKNGKASVFYYVGQRGMQYRKNVAEIVMISRLQTFGEAILKMSVGMYPPDRRRRDIDNLCKALFDSLQYAGLYKDDVQIHKLYIEKFAPVKPGRLEIVITTI